MIAVTLFHSSTEHCLKNVSPVSSNEQSDDRHRWAVHRGAHAKVWSGKDFRPLFTCQHKNAAALQIEGKLRTEWLKMIEHVHCSECSRGTGQGSRRRHCTEYRWADEERTLGLRLWHGILHKLPSSRCPAGVEYKRLNLLVSCRGDDRRVQD